MTEIFKNRMEFNVVPLTGMDFNDGSRYRSLNGGWKQENVRQKHKSYIDSQCDQPCRFKNTHRNATAFTHDLKLHRFYKECFQSKFITIFPYRESQKRSFHCICSLLSPRWNWIRLNAASSKTVAIKNEKSFRFFFNRPCANKALNILAFSQAMTFL